MKIESTGKAPSGKPIITLRLGGPDLGIIEGLLETALKHTPKTAETEKTIQRMQAMKRCFNSPRVQDWIYEMPEF